MINPAKPFSSTGYTHRERRFTIEEVRKLKDCVYILTDLPGFQDLELMLASDGVLSSLDELADAKIAESAFYVYFSNDEAAVAPLGRIIACGGIFIPPMQFSKTTYSRISAHVAATLTESNAAAGELFCGTAFHGDGRIGGARAAGRAGADPIPPRSGGHRRRGRGRRRGHPDRARDRG